ncbi:hypothetical protein [Fructobacillus fructosus]|uniref:hypothetical protein n=1 Tax=Fructobacillus fructosus TaxID=1631 RepID=UPI00200AFA42|nr:hypothetical protein [Fructobacillus fructosus]MCK8638991.1 hypothetical protein [Fructobacillus fructosus]
MGLIFLKEDTLNFHSILKEAKNSFSLAEISRILSDMGIQSKSDSENELPDKTISEYVNGQSFPSTTINKGKLHRYEYDDEKKQEVVDAIFERTYFSDFRQQLMAEGDAIEAVIQNFIAKYHMRTIGVATISIEDFVEEFKSSATKANSNLILSFIKLINNHNLSVNLHFYIQSGIVKQSQISLNTSKGYNLYTQECLRNLLDGAKKFGDYLRLIAGIDYSKLKEYADKTDGKILFLRLLCGYNLTKFPHTEDGFKRSLESAYAIPAFYEHKIYGRLKSEGIIFEHLTYLIDRINDFYLDENEKTANYFRLKNMAFNKLIIETDSWINTIARYDNKMNFLKENGENEYIDASRTWKTYYSKIISTNAIKEFEELITLTDAEKSSIYQEALNDVADIKQDNSNENYLSPIVNKRLTQLAKIQN